MKIALIKNIFNNLCINKYYQIEKLFRLIIIMWFSINSLGIIFITKRIPLLRKCSKTQVDLRVFLRIEPEVKYSKIYRGQTIF